MSTPTLVDAQVIEKDLTERAGSTAIVEQRISDLTIETEDDAKVAAEIAAEISQNLKDLDQQRSDLSLPLSRHVKKINGLFKEPLDRLKRMKASIAQKIGGYQKMLRDRAAEDDRKRRKAEQDAIAAKEKAEKAAAKPAADAEDDIERMMAECEATETQEALTQATEAPAVETKASAWSGGAIQTRRIWKSTIEDAQAIPVTAFIDGQKFILLKPDPAAITAYRRAYIKAHPPTDDVESLSVLPGVKFIREDSVA